MLVQAFLAQTAVECLLILIAVLSPAPPQKNAPTSSSEQTGQPAAISELHRKNEELGQTQAPEASATSSDDTTAPVSDEEKQQAKGALCRNVTSLDFESTLLAK